MSTLEAIEQFTAWDGVSRLDDILLARRRGPNFFHIASRVMRVEGIHSDLIAWLLDPQGWHGLGDGFVVPFMGEVLRAAGVFNTLPLSHVRVDKEFGTGNGPIDVLVRGNQGDTPVVIGIENKIKAALGKRQLERYASGLAASFPRAFVVLVLLTPEERDVDRPRVEGCEFVQTTYHQVVTHLRKGISAVKSGGGGAGLELARHYLDALRTDIVSEPHPEVDQILRELFDKHREAWCEIRRRMPSERDEHHAALATALGQRLSATHQGPWRFTLRRERYVRVFCSAWSAVGFGEADPVVGLTDSELGATRYPRVHFRLTARPGGDDAEAWDYDARIRLDSRDGPAVGAALRSELIDLGYLAPKHRHSEQVTITLKQTSKLAGLGEELVPESVVEWYTTYLGPVIPVLDKHLAQAASKD